MQVNDLPLAPSDVRQLESADEIARFFARLGYNVDRRINIADYALLGLGSADLRQQIHKIELIGTDPADGDITIYLFEVRSVTAKLRNEIARRFRERLENTLLVLTTDYAQLEFVLLERGLARSQSPAQPLKQTLRPIPLTLNRLNPEPVALRVLKRFTFTEEDAAYQWEKLRSAYMLAEWSEEYFNNRALFSDYYLKQRLTDPKLTPEWAEDVRPIGRALYAQLVTARKEFTRKPEQTIRTNLYEPLFQQLGFAFVAQKLGSSAAETPYGRDISRPSYLLYAPGKLDTPIAAALTYVWNRNLDDQDEARELSEADGGTPREIPGALVVSLLEAQVAPWVLVTNGKLWRLYSATASNKATNYYEVDLEEALAANDQLTALKYWWLLFRRQAFTGFLDTLLKRSADYAKELGERLKDRVFVEIFPQFAKGFIADMRAKQAAHALTPGPSPASGRGEAAEEPSLETVFSGTMTFLYRLMFLLYAESLELLPVSEANGYRQQSLYQLKRELAEAAGTLLDASPDKLAKRYSASSTALYERLKALFTVIDQGSDELNMPTYNGGLFSPQTEGGQFLDSYAIPDRFLALGLDRLARDVDARTKGLVFIDFKSLGVRQLGSIYEGLLEFRLRIAAEQLAVTKEKGKELYAPFAKVKKPLATLEKGEVYLENDKQERKATGSYYTPDYIVKYIVQHTVGPVLDRTFAQLTPRLRAAQKGYRDYARLAQARQKSSGKSEAPTAYWNSPELRQLADDCLNIRCLDPAMGSGHFLVEVVDYVSNRLISFLNGWSENPVWAFVEQTRDDILGEMERQRVTIDPERLTRVALLKRAVLKRCVYGVDLNAMAVELAKVSLWLDAFTLGAPLSFLDHHLKHGNSLIGARVREVQAYLKASDQLDMFSGSKFAGVMLATDLMRQVSYLSDNTVAQTQLSAQAYRDASDHLAPYKRLLDVYTSRWFGNAQAKKTKTDYVRLFLQEPQAEAWLENPAVPLDNRLIPADTITQTALRAAADKRFFHWELEFPEVFFAPSTPGGQDVDLVEGGGFDAVVGNPPYIRVQGIEYDEIDYLKGIYQSAYRRIDISTIFLEKSVLLLAQRAISGLIITNQFMTAAYGTELRQFLINETLPIFIDFKDLPVFQDALTYVCISLVAKVASEIVYYVDIYSKFLREHPAEIPAIVQNVKPFEIPKSYLDSEGWSFPSPAERLIIEKMKTVSVKLVDIGEARTGLFTGLDEVMMIYPEDEAKLQLEEEVLLPVLSGTEPDRYYLNPAQKKVIYPYKEVDGKTVLIDENELSERFPKTYQYLIGAKHKLLSRKDSRREFSENKMWYQLTRFGTSSLFRRPKILTPGEVWQNSFCIDDEGLAFSVARVFAIISDQVNLHYLLAILNSRLLEFQLQLAAPPKQGGYSAYSGNILEKALIFNVKGTTPIAEHTFLFQAAIASYDAGDSAALLAQVQAALDAEQTDVVHDLLAHLAQRMIDLNKQKQAEVKRFLGWVEGRLKIKAGRDAGGAGMEGRDISRPYNAGDAGGAGGAGGAGAARPQAGIDSLPGKSILQNYLGDYQKGEREQPWREFLFRLHQNRNRFAVALSMVEGEIERAYEQSLAALLPLKRALARTDTLIDKIVYRLYGLTDAEIELIERPQYEQALTDAKAQVVGDAKLTDDELKLDKIAEAILPAAERYFERVAPQPDEALLDSDLPGWRTLPPAAPTFLLTGDYNLRTLPEQMDFSTSIIPYTKAVEVVLYQRIFVPFRDASGNSDANCKNDFLKKFMRRERELTLGSFGIILNSTEPALRAFIGQQIPNAATTFFGETGVVGMLNDQAMVKFRNDAAHDEVLTRSEAQAMRGWALGILGLL